MELTNEQRKYPGLELIEPNWERVEIPNNCVKPERSTGKDILFFDGDVLRKVIWLHNNGHFRENSYVLRTQDNRIRIAPLTEKGKPKLLNGVNIQRCTPYGMYFDYNGRVLIANYTMQQTYYSSAFAGASCVEQGELQEFLTKEQLQDRIDKSRKQYTLIEYKGGQGIGQIVSIRHEGCGKQFTIGLREFEKRPFCRCCNEGYIYTEQFERKFKELVGNEYEIVTTFRRQNEPVEVRHRKCGTITKGLPSSFLKGKRCALCTPKVPKRDMIKHVNVCTDGRYHVSVIERNKITICDSEGKSITDTVQFFLQELSRDTESSIFNYRVKKPNIPLREAAVVYFMIKAECEKWGIWLQKEADHSIMDYDKIKVLTVQLVKEGYIFRKQTGVFCLDADLPDESIIREMYLNRRGEQIGAYYHESAAFHAGIIDTKPEIEYILSSNVKTQDFRSYMVGNTEIKIREPYAKITDKNYAVIEAINLLMFSGKHPEYKHKVEDYLLKKKISIADMEPYFEQYPFMIWKIVRELYR